MTYKSDSYYIEKVIEGSLSDFSSLVDKHKDRVFNLAFRICGNREDAEEIAQDTFIKIFNSLTNFRNNSAFTTWMYRITYNTAVTYLRKKKKEFQAMEFPEEMIESLEDADENEEGYSEYRKSILNLALQKISEDERAIISLYYYEDLSTEEISEVTGISRVNVKVKLFRARQRLLKIIETEEERKSKYYEKV
jgi:RNA polymerase sigma factor (sigma-70 family)